MEPLRTDEPLQPGSAKQAKDMDAAMLGGCSVFLTTSIVAFGLAVWPHLLYANAERASTLRMCLLIGLPASLVAGLVGARQGGLAGACGFVSGALTTSVFLFLRLQQIFVTADAHTGPHADYSPAVMYLLPISWFLGSVVVAAVAMPRIKPSGLAAEKYH